MYYKLSYQLVQDTINELNSTIQELTEEVNNSRFPQGILDRLAETDAQLQLLENLIKGAELVDGK